jgi:hypothetical protein
VGEGRRGERGGEWYRGVGRGEGIEVGRGRDIAVQPLLTFRKDPLVPVNPMGLDSGRWEFVSLPEIKPRPCRLQPLQIYTKALFCAPVVFLKIRA